VLICPSAFPWPLHFPLSRVALISRASRTTDALPSVQSTASTSSSVARVFQVGQHRPRHCHFHVRACLMHCQSKLVCLQTAGPRELHRAEAHCTHRHLPRSESHNASTCGVPWSPLTGPHLQFALSGVKRILSEFRAQPAEFETESERLHLCTRSIVFQPQILTCRCSSSNSATRTSHTASHISPCH